MAYATVNSLTQTIHRILNSSHIMFLGPSAKIIRFALRELRSLQQVLERLDICWNMGKERLNILDEQIREAVFEFEDVLESHVSNQFLSQYEDRSLAGEDVHVPAFSSFSLDLNELIRDLNFFRQTVKEMKEEYIKELMSNPKDDAAVDQWSRSDDLGGTKSKMVGLSEVVSLVQYDLTKWYLSEMLIIALHGMAGSGKTTIARQVFEDPGNVDYFECRAWVRVGPRYRLKEIVRSILAQVLNSNSETGDDEELLGWYLKGRRYLIVLDDIWESQVCDDLKMLLPEISNGSRILVTSTIEYVATQCTTLLAYKVRFMNKEESWHLLRDKVFGEGLLCPPELEKPGKKIAENCEGLPLTIVTVARILSKADKTPEFWNEVAKKETSVFFDAYEEISEVIFPSYNYLPQNLKSCFLYMGILPLKYEISRSKLINLWSCEGFLGPNPYETFEQFVKKCLEELLSRNVILVVEKTIFCPFVYDVMNVETYRLHSAFLHLCVREAAKNKFLYVLNHYGDIEGQGIDSQRRLCIHNNVLFSIKDVYNSMESVSTARSLLCTGPNHKYPVSICFGLRLLRVLDSLAIRFYEFPVGVLKLIQLRYFSLTYDGKLPASISILQNLECLIVHRHVSIKFKSREGSSYLPMEIWDMKELKHIEIMGRDLPEPHDEGSLLPNLLELLDVSSHSCTKRVLERVPNPQELRIPIELEADVNAAAELKPLSCFDHITSLHALKTLECKIVNPIFTSEVVAPPPPPPLSTFPSGLAKLTLSGLGYPWEEMNKIASLPNLQVLELQCYAFRGPKWRVHDRGFPILQYLSIEDSDLVVWTFGGNHFPYLSRLSIKHCYKLREIRGQFGTFMRDIEIVDADPLVETWAEQVAFLDVHYSWEDKKLQS